MSEYGGIYRPEPQPTQGRRFVPIPAQGDQPPRRNAALAMAVVLACWPTGFEHQPQQRRLNVAPLTLTYGDQPPRLSRDYLKSLFTWQDSEQPQQRRAGVAPLIEVAVAQPPYTRQPESVLGSWEPLPSIVQRRGGIAPLTLTYGDDPPRRTNASQYALISTWIPPPPEPQQRPLKVAPLTLAYGDQPTPRSLAGLLSILRTAWEPPAPQPQRDPKNIAPLTLVYGDDPGRRSNAGFFANLESWRPPDPLPQQQRRDIAPLTLAYGDQPPPLRRATYQWPEVEQPQQRWTTYPQAAVIAAEQPAYARLPHWIVAAWEQQQPVVRRVLIAPLTLVYGDQPPPLVRQRLQTPLDDVPQQRRASYTQAAVAAEQPPFTRLPAWILESWQQLADPIRRPTLIAPLTLIYGDQPPPYAPGQLRSLLRTAWEPLADHVQRRELIAPPTVVVVVDDPPPRSMAQLLAIIRGHWEQEQPRHQMSLGLGALSFIAGPYYIDAFQIYVAGSVMGQSAAPGSVAGQCHVAGSRVGSQS